ncbi:MAG TPA: pyridoxal-phosphate dependent enzyme [Kofleriaceae bacterium]|nr:pyridoxal-phosphate dependent enzyme [Kofleriaceae bacterium]
MQAVLVIGDPRLRVRCAPVADGYPELAADAARLVAALGEVRARTGFGRALAAPQLGIARRIVAMDLGAGPFLLVDPELTWRSPELVDVWDDCFSVPDRLVRVARHRSVSLRFRDGALRPRTWTGLPPDLAELVQHELDHLDGVLMTDRATAEAPMSRRAELVERPARRLDLARIAEAMNRIDPVFLRTPQYACEPLGERLGCRLTLKVETQNPIRSFKGRGADYHVGLLEDRAPLTCASAGNFGQAMAYACRARGIPLTVFAARGASPLKVERMRALGAEVILAGDDLEAAKRAARAHGGRFVEDGREPRIAEGAGTIAVELLAGDAHLDAVVVPLGDGALLGGVARWIKAASPATRVIGACSRGAPAMYHAWTGAAVAGADALVDTIVDTIADGIAVRAPVPASVADLRDLADGVVQVADATLIEAMRLVHAHAGLVAEPSAVAGLAAILEDPGAFAGQRIATVVTGGNLTAEQVRAWLAT